MIELNTIHVGNCFDLFSQIEPKSVDLIFTDPPYTTKSLAELYKWNDDLEFHVLSWYFNKILKDNGQLCIFADFFTAVEVFNSFQNYFRFRFWWIWNKPLGQPVGSGKKQPISDCELLLVFCRKKAKRMDLTFNYQDIYTPGEPYKKEMRHQNRTRKKHQPYETVNETGDRYPKQVLYYPSKCNLPKEERTSHPSQKPLGLCEYIIKALTNEGNLVLDPFTGSGSIPIASHRLKRHYLGIEINPEYYQEAMKRFETEIKQEVLF